MTRIKFVMCALTICAIAQFGCSEDLTQEDTPPRVVAVGPLERVDARTVFVNYSLTDRERDDATLAVEICQGDACAPAVQGEGGDGLSRVPTIPALPDADSASKVFAWDVACGTVDPSTGDFAPLEIDAEFRIGFRVIGGADELVLGPVTTLTALGYTSSDGSGNVDPCQQE